MTGTIGGSLGGVQWLNLVPLSTLFLWVFFPPWLHASTEYVDTVSTTFPCGFLIQTLSTLYQPVFVYTQIHIRPNTKTQTHSTQDMLGYRNYKSYNANHIFAYCSFIPRIWILVLQHFARVFNACNIKKYLAWVYIEFSNFEPWLSCSWFISYLCKNLCGVGIFKNYERGLLGWKSLIYLEKTVYCEI